MRIRSYLWLAVFLCLVFFVASSLPSFAEGADSIPQLILDESIIDPQTITDRKFSGGMIQVLMGCQFSDGSFDIWQTIPAFAVNGSVVITGNAFPSFSSLIKDMSKAQRERYIRLGVDLAAINSEILTYRVYAGGDKFFSAQKINSGDAEPYSIFSVQGLLKHSYSLFSSDSNPVTTGYAVGVLSSAVTTDHLFTGTDFIEQKIKVLDTGDGKTFSFISDSDEYFIGCPVVSSTGELIGVVDSYSTGETSTAHYSRELASVLQRYSVDYKETEKESIVVDLTGLQNAVAVADKIRIDQLKAEDAERLASKYEAAVEALQNPNLTKDRATALEAELLAEVEACTKTRNRVIRILILVTMLCIITGTVFITLAVRLFKLSRSKKCSQAQQVTKPVSEDFLSSCEKILHKILPCMDWSKQIKENTVESTDEVPDLDDISMGEEANLSEYDDAEPYSEVEAQVFENMISDNEEANPKPSFEIIGDERESTSVGPAILDEFDIFGSNIQDTSKSGRKVPFLVLSSSGEEVPVNKSPFLVGKSTEASLRVNNETVSRKHFEIVNEDSSYFIRDLGSLNGTALNDIILKEGFVYRLHDGDVVYASDERLTVVFKEEG